MRKPIEAAVTLAFVAAFIPIAALVEGAQATVGVHCDDCREQKKANEQKRALQHFDDGVERSEARKTTRHSNDREAAFCDV